MPQFLLNFVSTTILPDIELANVKNGKTTTTPGRPRTDLSVLAPWTGFNELVLDNRRNLDGLTTLRGIGPIYGSLVSSEKGVVYWIRAAILATLQAGLVALDVSDLTFADAEGENDVVGAPDIILVRQPATKAILTFEIKTPWAFPRLNDPVAAYHDEVAFTTQLLQAKKKFSPSHTKIQRTFGQLYGYMSFNSNRYGVLSTYDETYFFQRVCSQGGGHLKVAGPFSHRSTQPFTVLEAYITILFLSRDHWFYGSPYSSPYSSQPGSPSSSRARLVRPADPYTVSDVDFEAIRFGKGCDRSNVGVIVRGTYFGRAAVFKIVDETKHVEHIESLNKEVDVYQHLASQQGQTIPKLLGFIRLWGMLRMLVLEDYGQSVEDAIKSPSAAVEDLKHECLQALDALHSQGFAHGDARIANFVVSVTGGVRILDFGEVKDATPEWTDLDRQKMLEGFDASTPNSVISVANTNSEHKS